jgi:periplasmic protein TonB
MKKKILFFIGSVLMLAGCQQTPAPRTAPSAIRSLSELPPGEIYAIADLDQAPQIGRRSQPQYPFELRRAGMNGEVNVGFVIGSDGRVYGAQAVSASHPGFVTAALEAVSRWTWTPGVKAGQPANCSMQVPIVFNLVER